MFRRRPVNEQNKTFLYVVPRIIYLEVQFTETTGYTYLDELLHADHVRLRHGEGVLEAVADNDHKGKALPVEVGSRGGLKKITTEAGEGGRRGATKY